MGREGDVDFANGSERNRRDDREESPAERDGMDVEMDGDEGTFFSQNACFLPRSMLMIP